MSPKTAILPKSFGLMMAIATMLASSAAIASEQVVLRYRAHRRSVSVEELTQLAQEGDVSRPLKSYLRTAGQDPETLRQLLNREAEVDPVLLDRLLNNPIGGFLLDRVAEGIYTPSQQADRQALRAALILSASDDGTVSLLEVLQNYPTPEVHIDGDRIGEAFNQIMELEERFGWLLR